LELILRLPLFGGANAITASDNIKILKAAIGNLILLFFKNGIILYKTIFFTKNYILGVKLADCFKAIFKPE
jgi:hypothetical protein